MMICDKCHGCGLGEDSYVCPCSETHPRPGCQECYTLEKYTAGVEKSKEISERNYRQLHKRHTALIMVLERAGILEEVLARVGTVEPLPRLRLGDSEVLL